MNLDNATSTTTLEPLAPPPWSMEVRREGYQFTAEVRRAAELMCRVSVVRPDDDDEAAARRGDNLRHNALDDLHTQLV